MDTQKNIDKNVMPETMTQPAQETEVKDKLDEMEMQPLPMMEPDMNAEGLPSMNMPCWHCPMMIEDIPESDVQMDEELNDMKQPSGQQITMPQMEIQEMNDTTAMRSCRDYYENYSDYDLNNFNYREYSHYDYNDHDHDHEHDYDDVDEILRKIERYNPGVFRRLASYGVPYPAARNIIRRVIRLTLNYK